MRLSNRRGVPIDPVPFIVVTGLGCMLLLSFGPLYGQAFGLSLSSALLVSITLSAVVTVGAFYWEVWDGTPAAETPVELRAERLYYGTLAFAVIFVVLTLPLLL